MKNRRRKIITEKKKKKIQRGPSRNQNISDTSIHNHKA